MSIVNTAKLVTELQKNNNSANIFLAILILEVQDKGIENLIKLYHNLDIFGNFDDFICRD